MKDSIAYGQGRPSLAILVAIAMGGSLAMNILLPSLPNIQATFSTNYATVQLTVTLFLVGLAAAQMVYGPLSDRFGRRPIVLVGLVVLIVGTIVCLLAPSIEIMIFGRILQAIGGSSGMVISRAMVRDAFSRKDAAAMIAYLTMAVVVVPTLAPLIGGYLDEWLSWRAGFVFILLSTLGFLIAALVWARETLPESKRQKIRFREQFYAIAILFRNPIFNGYALQMSFSTAAYFAFLGGSPFVLINLMGTTPGELGLYFVAVSIFYIGGNYGTALLSKKIEIERIVTVGTWISLVGGAAMLLLALRIGLAPFSFIALMSVVGLGNGLCISAGMANAIGADRARIGAASGLAGSMQMGFGGLASYISSIFLEAYQVTPVPLVVVIVVCCALALISPLIGRRALVIET